MRNIAFTTLAFEQYSNWGSEDFKIFGRITQLLKEMRRDPFVGIGKPEPLKHTFKGCWSRRIDDKNRVIYKVSADEILIISCKGHYA